MAEHMVLTVHTAVIHYSQDFVAVRLGCSVRGCAVRWLCLCTQW